MTRELPELEIVEAVDGEKVTVTFHDTGKE